MFCLPTQFDLHNFDFALFPLQNNLKAAKKVGKAKKLEYN